MNFGNCVHLCRHLPKQNTDFCHYIMFLMSLPVSYHLHKQLFSGLHHHVLFLPFLGLYVSKQTLCIVLCLSSFTQHNILETHVCCCLFLLPRNSIPFYNCITISTVSVYEPIYLFRDLSYFQSFASLWIKLLWAFVYKNICSFRLCKYLEVGLLVRR